MKVMLAYGENGLTIDLPRENVTVVTPRYLAGATDEAESVRQSLRDPIASPPLRDIVRSTDRVVIVTSDITRPVPHRVLFPPLLTELNHVPDRQITILNGVGLHRPNSPAELERMFGPDIVERFRVVNHDPHCAENLVRVGTSQLGAEIWLNRLYVEADVRVVTGFIEPHFFAGFSGGQKGVIPGVAGAATITHNHGAKMIGHPRARWGELSGNPIHEEQREGVSFAPPHFLLNVATNREKQITAVFAGDYLAAHDAGCAFVRETAMQTVPRRYPIVITTNSGYPLDLNLYQAVKGIAAAEEIVAPGGTIIIAAECREGVGHGEFAELLHREKSPLAIAGLIERPDFQMLDQWQVQILARILTRHRVLLYSDRIDPDDVRRAHLEPITSIEAAVADLLTIYGPDAPICVLPEGPLTIPVAPNR